jgi:hypothetical protein
MNISDEEFQEAFDGDDDEIPFENVCSGNGNSFSCQHYIIALILNTTFALSGIYFHKNLHIDTTSPIYNPGITTHVWISIIAGIVDIFAFILIGFKNKKARITGISIQLGILGAGVWFMRSFVFGISFLEPWTLPIVFIVIADFVNIIHGWISVR